MSRRAPLAAMGEAFAEGFTTGFTTESIPPDIPPDYSHLAEPRDETETLATCPKCKCMGHHLVQVGTFRARKLPGARPGVWIDASMFGDPPDGTKVVTRTCIFCDYQWSRG
jgi:hypothetical protein